MELARRLRERPGVVHLDLGRLAAAEAASMVQACTPGAPPELVARVQLAAEGVPLMVEEVLASPGVPTSLAETVRARLAELDDEERLVLASAAVIGRNFPWRLLPAATGALTERVSSALGRGTGCQLLAVEGDGFTFRHALIREAIVEELLPPRRGIEILRELPQRPPARTGPSGPSCWPAPETAAPAPPSTRRSASEPARSGSTAA